MYDADGLADLSEEGLPEQERGALHFCKKWIKGYDSFIVKTSGSTGSPKEIKISNQRMQESAMMTLKALNIQEETTALLCINAVYIGGMMMLVRAMVGGLTLHVRTPSSTPLGGGLPPIGFCAVVPMQLEGILSAGGDGLAALNGMQAVIVGGAPVSDELEEQTQKVAAPLYATFGMTETVSHFALRRINGPGAGGFYTAFEEMDLATDERGCLRVKGTVTDNRWIQTNDIVELIHPGRFRWMGRADNVINSGGVKLHPEEIERKLSGIWFRFAREEAFFTTGLPDDKLGEKLVLLIEGEPFAAQNLSEIQSEMHRVLTPYEVPREIHFVPAFERTETGKVRRKVTAATLNK